MGLPIFLEGRTLELGRTYVLPVKFLSPDEALREITPGRQVGIWEGQVVGEAVIVTKRGKAIGRT